MQKNDSRMGQPLYRINGKEYSSYVFGQALCAMSEDSDLAMEIQKLKEKCMEKWLIYYACEERLEEERRQRDASMAQGSDICASETTAAGPMEGMLRDCEEH